MFNAHGDQLICNDALTSSRERLYEMMKQQQFCDAVLGTSLHSVKVREVLCMTTGHSRYGQKETNFQMCFQTGILKKLLYPFQPPKMQNLEKKNQVFK